jgi:hypothetical protein
MQLCLSALLFLAQLLARRRAPVERLRGPDVGVRGGLERILDDFPLVPLPAALRQRPDQAKRRLPDPPANDVQRAGPQRDVPSFPTPLAASASSSGDAPPSAASSAAAMAGATGPSTGGTSTARTHAQANSLRTRRVSFCLRRNRSIGSGSSEMSQSSGVMTEA